jgi:hypothetical protein
MRGVAVDQIGILLTARMLTAAAHFPQMIRRSLSESVKER